MIQNIRVWCVMLCLACMSVAWAGVAPVQALEKMTGRLIQQIKKNQPKFDRDPDLIYRMIKKTVMPLIAQQQMGQYVVGRTDWKRASAQQRKAFLKYFSKMVVATYAGAIKSYSDQVVRYYPLRGDISKASIVSVRSLIEPADGPSVQVSYQMIRLGNRWKILDFSVDGVSLVNSYRAQFRSTLSSGGIKALNRQLKRKVNAN